MRAMTSQRPGRRAVSTLFALLTILAGLAFAASPASAGPRLSVGTSIPSTVTVGQTGLPSQLRILNTSFNGPGEAGYTTDSFNIPDPLVPFSITMVPSCGSQNASADCTPPAAYDPGVIVPSATGMGEAGSACAGRTFTITLIDIAQGKYNFAPDAPFTLGPSSGGGAPNECVINFTVDVQRAPTIDANPAAAGLQTDQRSAAFAVDIGPTNAGQRASGTGTAETTVLLATPAITTVASDGTIGGTIGDTATLTGLANPVTGAGAGTVTFRLYSGPQSDGCTAGNLVDTSPPRPITFTGGPPPTGGTATYTFAPQTAGTYHWVASFSGDVNNNAVAGACTAANEVSQLAPNQPSITTQATNGTIGGTIGDTATISGLVLPVTGAGAGR